jgi:hypothetical protein
VKKLALWLSVGLLSAGGAWAQADSKERVVESIVPLLDNNSSCWSAVNLQNLGNRDIEAEVEAHSSSGALVALVGHNGIQVRLKAGEKVEYRPQLSADEASGGWVRVREMVPGANLSPVLAVRGTSECLAANELQTTVRDIAWPVRNPWFSSEVHDGEQGILALINTTGRPARVWGCYSSGVKISVPRGEGAELTPLCSETIGELVPPYGSRRYVVARGDNSHFSLNTQGDAIVLQMLRTAGTDVKAYKVDSTITFGEQVSRP